MIKILGYSYSKKIRMSDNLMFIIIISVLIIITNTYGNYFKYFLTLVIISSTIEVSVEFGTFITVVSSVIILCIDLTYKPITSVNYYFRNDLILIVVFMLLAWPILCYIRIIDNSIKKKNHQLMILNSEIEKKDEQNREMEKYVMTNKVCYNLFIKNSYEAILIHHFDKLIFANESATKLLGVKKTSSLISKSIYSFFPNEDNEKIKTQFKQIYEEKNIKTVFEHRILNYDNILINIENTSAFFIYQGKATILSVFRNISAEKQVKQLQRDIQKNSKLLEESRKSNKEIMEFFVNISHELKTPLNLIFSSLQMINLYNQHKDGYIEKRSNYVKIIKNNSYRLLKLINNLLDSTKTDNGFSKLHFENKNIISFVEDVTLSVAYYAESRGIRLIFDTDVEEKNMAFDCDKVERIILNLLSNSVKFTNSGGEIYVNIKDGKDYIVISVKDTGIGIPKDKQKVIFEKFGQVDKTLSRNKEGTGLGLSIVKSFVELHGGNIKVKSEIGKGSEFIVKLPVKHIKSSKENKTFFETDTERINIEFSDI
ncbi:PAS domain-containing sensor histidine kinase [Clostridium akagii]|uniref:PAS domain-containing sensor histidine kinase n=1 Tax=Clostridium akagii TaxID=91623 RepID=UPI001FA79F22|nr:PAS domain-containing sensor histidine kinase [Clostridium akagii]